MDDAEAAVFLHEVQIWVQIGEVVFSINCFTAPYSPILILFGGVHLDPCAFDYTKYILDDFEPLAAMLFCQSTLFYLSSWNFGPQQPLNWSRSNQTFDFQLGILESSD